MGIFSFLNGATLGIILTAAATTVGGLGVFSEAWWKDSTGRTYSIFTVVNCTDSICSLGVTDNEGLLDIT